MRASFLPFSPPDVTEAEIAEVTRALRSGWITTGPRTARFEEAFADYVGAEAALAVNSGTAALHVGLLAHGIGPGDAVLVPTLTFASAAHVVEHVGATPILTDVDRVTLNMGADDVVQATRRSDAPVRCILPVHLHGHPADLPTLRVAAGSDDLPIVDDAAHAVPAAIGGTRIGGSRDPKVLTAFSFYATKNLATGEGGMLTGPRDLVEEARAWVLHGMTKDAWRRHEDGALWRYDIDRAGFKYNLSDIQAALGLVQLSRLDEMHARRCEVAARYSNAFSSIEQIELPHVSDDVRHAWHIYAIRLHLDRLTIPRDRFIDHLRERNIGASVHFIPIHTFTHYRERFPHDAFPVADAEFERLVSLPIYPGLGDADIDDVIDAVASIVAAHSR